MTSAAARAHEMTPSAVSKLISRLEDRLQVRLFQRGTRSLTLTEEGAAYLRSARAVVEAMAEADSLAEALPTRVSGTLRIHTMTTFAKHQIAPWLPEFLDRYPALQVEIQVGAQYVDQFEQGLDLLANLGRERVAGEPDEGEQVPRERCGDELDAWPRPVGQRHHRGGHAGQVGVGEADHEIVRQRGQGMDERLAVVARRREIELGHRRGRALARGPPGFRVLTARTTLRHVPSLPSCGGEHATIDRGRQRSRPAAR